MLGFRNYLGYNHKCPIVTVLAKFFGINQPFKLVCVLMVIK